MRLDHLLSKDKQGAVLEGAARRRTGTSESLSQVAEGKLDIHLVTALSSFEGIPQGYFRCTLKTTQKERRNVSISTMENLEISREVV